MGQIVQILKNRSLLADKVSVADRPWDRLKGLLGVTGLEKGGGLLIPACNSVHMWGMSIALDIVFLRRIDGKLPMDTRYRITSIRPRIKPWRIFPLGDLRATDTLELAAGFAAEGDLKVGQELDVSIKGGIRT